MRGRREEGQEDQEDQLNEAVWQEKQAEKEGGGYGKDEDTDNIWETLDNGKEKR